MDCRADVEGKLALAALLIETYPATGVLLVSDRQAELALPAMRAGVQDILSPEASMEEFGAAVESIAQATRNRVQQLSEVPDEAVSDRAVGPDHRIMSPKGGVGKTTVSTNIAVGLAQREPGSTVIVDLDVQFGDVARAGSGAHPLPRRRRAWPGPLRRDGAQDHADPAQDRAVCDLCAQLPEEADTITPEDVTHLLKMLGEFRYVVLDTSPGMSDTTLAALDQTTDLVLLTGMDVPGIRGLRKELDTLATLGVHHGDAPDRAELRRPEGPVVPGRRGGHHQDPGELRCRATRATVNSVNQGIPLLESGQQNPMTKQLHEAGGAAGRPTSHRRAMIPPSRRQPWWRRKQAGGGSMSLSERLEAQRVQRERSRTERRMCSRSRSHQPRADRADGPGDHGHVRPAGGPAQRPTLTEDQLHALVRAELTRWSRRRRSR